MRGNFQVPIQEMKKAYSIYNGLGCLHSEPTLTWFMALADIIRVLGRNRHGTKFTQLLTPMKTRKIAQLQEIIIFTCNLIKNQHTHHELPKDTYNPK